MLLEIGILESVKAAFKLKFQEPERTREFSGKMRIKECLVKTAKEELPKNMGTKYANAVLTCLEDRFNVQKDDKHHAGLAMAFETLVLGALENGLKM